MFVVFSYHLTVLQRRQCPGRRDWCICLRNSISMCCHEHFSLLLTLILHTKCPHLGFTRSARNACKKKELISLWTKCSKCFSFPPLFFSFFFCSALSPFFPPCKKTEKELGVQVWFGCNPELWMCLWITSSSRFEPLAELCPKIHLQQNSEKFRIGLRNMESKFTLV